MYTAYMNTIPLIDIREFRQGNTNVPALNRLDSACREHGFFLLSGHGLDDLINQVWTETERFFDAPRSFKHDIMRNEINPMGYYDRELTKQQRDLKEVFDFKAGGYQSSRPERQQPWPRDMSEFRATMETYFSACTELAHETLDLIYRALSLDPSAIADDFGEQHTSSVRLNYYPVDDPLSGEEQSSVNPLGDMALHHHTDPGTLTLLLQDNIGGLQTQLRDGSWIDVPPTPGTFVVNLGDIVQVRSNDQYIAATHRVVPMKGTARYSAPFFFQPRFDAVIEPIAAVAGNQPKYQPFTWREYIRGRAQDNYSDQGEDDIQISRYLVT